MGADTQTCVGLSVVLITQVSTKYDSKNRYHYTNACHCCWSDGTDVVQ